MQSEVAYKKVGLNDVLGELIGIIAVLFGCKSWLLLNNRLIYLGIRAFLMIPAVSLVVGCDKDNNSEANLPTEWYLDNDGDTFGNPSSMLSDSIQPAGYVANDLDCDDADPNNFPNNTEITDGSDNNCNGIVDEVRYEYTLGASAFSLDQAVPVGCDGGEGYELATWEVEKDLQKIIDLCQEEYVEGVNGVCFTQYWVSGGAYVSKLDGSPAPAFSSSLFDGIPAYTDGWNLMARTNEEKIAEALGAGKTVCSKPL